VWIGSDATRGMREGSGSIFIPTTSVYGGLQAGRTAHGSRPRHWPLEAVRGGTSSWNQPSRSKKGKQHGLYRPETARMVW
jgi:hypothetical protein